MDTGVIVGIVATVLVVAGLIVLFVMNSPMLQKSENKLMRGQDRSAASSLGTTHYRSDDWISNTVNPEWNHTEPPPGMVEDLHAAGVPTFKYGDPNA